MPATGSTEQTDGSCSMLSTTICTTVQQYPEGASISLGASKPRSYYHCFQKNLLVLGCFQKNLLVLGCFQKKLLPFPHKTSIPQQIALYFSVCVHRTCLVHQSLNMKIKISQIVPVIEKVIIIANLLYYALYIIHVPSLFHLHSYM